MLQKKRFTPHEALQQAKHYCAYQERCHSEVKDRLYSFGLATPDVESILSQLIEENYLNEERFAKAFVRGKFRMKEWGKVKIRHELKMKKVSEYCIRKGLTEINDDEYLKTLTKLAEQKWKVLKAEKNIFIKKRKLMDYLLQKGYERGLIADVINQLQSL